MQFFGAGTSRTFRPVWTAEELNLDYELVPIGPRTGETQTDEYTRLNPKQKIPVLVDGTFILTESVAICRYLINKYGGESTLYSPSDMEAHAKEDEWVAYIYGEIDETSLYVMRRHGDLKAIYGEAPQALDAARNYALKHLGVVAAHLKDKQFLVGNRFGVADIFLMSCLDWAFHYGLDLAESLKRYRNAISHREAYKRAFTRNFSGQQLEQ